MLYFAYGLMMDFGEMRQFCGLMDESGQRLVHKKLPYDLPSIKKGSVVSLTPSR